MEPTAPTKQTYEEEQVKNILSYYQKLSQALDSFPEEVSGGHRENFAWDTIDNLAYAMASIGLMNFPEGKDLCRRVQAMLKEKMPRLYRLWWTHKKELYKEFQNKELVDLI